MENISLACFVKAVRSMQVLDTVLDDVKLLEPKVFGDSRGFFMESWSQKVFDRHFPGTSFVQDNHSMSQAGVLRGLHYQVKHPQGKLVRVVTGAVFDVAVDMRRQSPQFGRWYGAELSAENKHMLWVPPGFAHGFLCLRDDTNFLYKCTDIYAPEHERSVFWNDSDIGIEWPVEGLDLTLSEKDKNGASFADAECYE